MSRIACKMKNSFAVDNTGNVYTWGNWETGLLANNAEADILRPNLVELRYSNTRYLAEKVSAGHFHAAIIANRADNAKKVKDLRYAINIFKKLNYWFQNIFAKNVPNYKAFLKFILRINDNVKTVKYEELEKLFLKSFYSYQKLNNRDIFKMNKAYEIIIRDEFEIPADKTEIEIAKLSKIETSRNSDVREIYHYAEACINHFKQFPDDLPYFIRMISRFEPMITLEDLRNIFEYALTGDYWEGYVMPMDSDNITKITELFNDLKIYDANDVPYIETDRLIDSIIGKQTGTGVVFTFGVSSEGRLGIGEPINEEKGREKNYIVNDNNEKDDFKLEVQRQPTIVYFPELFVKIVKVACGYAHTLALSEEQVVYSWGSGKYGCLGNSKNENSYTPQRIVKDFDKNDFKEIIDISAGMYFSLALENDGRVYSWGCGNNGRLGHGEENSVGHPKIINYFNSNEIKVSQISAGDTHACAISTSKEIFSWGNANFGKLGHGSFDDVKIPLMIEFFKNIKMEFVTCGSYNTVCITTDSRVYAWGKNSHGMLGIPYFAEQNILTPTEVILNKDEYNTQVSEISVGSMHTMILCTNGSIYTCGNTICGILGLPDVYDKVIIPRKIMDTKFFVTDQPDIIESSFFKEYHSDFTIKRPFSTIAISAVFTYCSAYNTAFITNNYELYMCGDSKLMHNPEKKMIVVDKYSDKTQDTPAVEEEGMQYQHSWSEQINRIIITTISEKVTYISISKHHVMCVVDKKVYSWGKNYQGVLGLASKSLNEYVKTPQLVEKINSAVKMTAVSDSHSLILCTNGEIYACGSNLYGKLGIGELGKYFEYDTDKGEPSTPLETEPTLVKNITFAEYISCSNNHSACIMKYDSNFAPSYMIFTWGSGFAGKLGHMDMRDISEPKKVEELQNKNSSTDSLYLIKIALGDEFTLALDIKGYIWGWGKKKYLGVPDDIGHFDESFHTTPKILFKDKKFKYITSSNFYCLAIDTDGNLFSWVNYP